MVDQQFIIMKEMLIILLVATGLVFVSGCTIPGLDVDIPFLPDIFPGTQMKEERHDIVAIEALRAIPSTIVRSGQTIRLQSLIKDLQKPEYEPVNVRVNLYNDCGLFDTRLELCSGGLKKGDTWCEFKMYPQSTNIVEWVMKAKDVNVETPCDVGVMVEYYYKTPTTSSATFVNKQELERLVSSGKGVKEIGKAVIGEGPIKTYIEVKPQPIVVGPDEEGSAVLTFWAENKGGGLIDSIPYENGNLEFGNVPEMNSLGFDVKKKVYITINGDNIKTVSGKSIEECVKEKMKSNGDKYSFYLIGRKTPRYSCSITAKDATRIKQEKTYQITSEIGYWYKFTREIKLTVRPKIRL